ncbi:ATP-binding cassette domain-containing protein [bacterium]|nr:ATP-binding cassette domain-containing protein [bacterium]
MSDFLIFDNVVKLYSNRWLALDRVSFSLDAGEFVFLVGPSGAGKSTLLKLIYLGEFPTYGEIRYLSWSTKTITMDEIPLLRRKVGVIFQDFKLLQEKTAYENIAFALRAVGKSRKEIRRRTNELLQSVGLSHKKDFYPPQLSGGEKQRISIARAIALSPPLILADEPTGDLDPETAGGIMELILNIHRQGTAVILATHNMDMLRDFDFRVLELREGKLV